MSRLHHVQFAIPPGREEDARAFYVGVLGLEALNKPAELAVRGGCWFRLGDVEIHAGADPEFKPPTPKAHLAFQVEDLDAIRRRLEDAGARLEMDVALSDRDRFFAYDPFGHRLEFIKIS